MHCSGGLPLLRVIRCCFPCYTLLLPVLYLVASLPPHALRCLLRPRPVPPGPLDYQGCGLLVDKEGILPGVSWGSATPDEQSLYTQSDCDAKVRRAARVATATCDQGNMSCVRGA